jgi:predicted nucleic acid-binding protein
MNGWLVDTNILLDIIGADARFGDRSRTVLEEQSESSVLVINPIVYAEVGALIDNREELDELLPLGLFRRDPLPYAAAFLAGQAFARYRRQGGNKKRMLADFLIGAHAAVADLGLITRDQGYARYFDIPIIDPS